MTIIIDRDIFQLVEFQHVKPGKGGAFVRTRLRNVRSSAVLEKTFRAGEKFEQAILERKDMQFLYKDGDMYYLMDSETFDQTPLTAAQIGDAVIYLKENDNVSVLTHEGEVLGVQLPDSVRLTVVTTDPGVRGDTATGGSKPATLETGAVVQVPLFVNEGDAIRVDTRSGVYLERA
jgi:elongation factor P